MKLSMALFLSLISSSLYSQEYWSNACSASKEYITTVNYLRDHKEFGLEDKQIREVADAVSLGCTDSALRFAKVMDLLVQASLPSHIALEEAKRLSQKTNAESDNFIAIFRRIYLEKFFDLSANDALALAKKLTFEVERDHVRVMNDFNILSDFCLERKGMDLSLLKCAEIIGKIIPKGEDNSNSIAKSFLELIEFLTLDEKGPKITLLKAIEITESVLDHGARATDNYILAYKFAINEKGLAIGGNEAMSFAQNMASRSIKKLRKQ
ncbi:MAG: hypothetical protein Fur0010_24420 [Bdellovibrio sp.]